jgi:hypothetical protein
VAIKSSSSQSKQSKPQMLVVYKQPAKVSSNTPKKGSSQTTAQGAGSGSSMYKGSGVHTVAIAKGVSQKSHFRCERTNDSNVVRIIGRELISAVSLASAANVVAGNILDLDICPSYIDGTKMQQEARLYEMWKLESMAFDFIAAVGSTTAGQLGMSYDPDVLGLTPPSGSDASLRAYSGFQDNIAIKEWDDRRLVVTSHEKKDWKWCNEDPGADPRLVYNGQVYIYCLVPTGLTLPATIGSMWIEYSILFKNRYVLAPQSGAAYSNTAITLQIPATTYTGGSPVAKPNLYAGALAYSGGVPQIQQLGSGAVQSASSVPFTTTPGTTPILREGTYLYTCDGELLNATTGQINPVSPVLKPIANSGSVLNNNENAPYGGNVHVVNYQTGATAGAPISYRGVLSVPPGGSALDNLYVMSSSATDTSATLTNLAFSFLPIAYNVANALFNLSAIVAMPRDVGPAERSRIIEAMQCKCKFCAKRQQPTAPSTDGSLQINFRR